VRGEWRQNEGTWLKATPRESRSIASAAKLLSEDEARRIAANIAKLCELLGEGTIET
jgi:hypothetical protein